MLNMTIRTLDGDGEFGAYAAGEPGRPAIIVLQEVFGVNRGIRAKCDAFARDGYRAVAPDLFWRVEPQVAFDPDVPEEFKQAIAVMMRFDQDLGIQDLEATLRHVRGEGSPKAGVVGYCLGGRMAYLCATRTDSDASVGYYGVGIDEKLGESHAIAKPLMLHFAEADHFVPAEKRQAVHAGLADNAHATLHDYPGVDHGFATEFGERRHEEMATLANGRTAEFFAKHLKG